MYVLINAAINHNWNVIPNKTSLVTNMHMIKKILGTIIIILWWYQLCSAFVEPQSNLDLLKLNNTINAFESANPATPPNKKKILNDFCHMVLKDPVSKGFDSEEDHYSSQNSLFLKLLCKETKILTQDSAFSPFLDSEEGYYQKNAANNIFFPNECQKDDLWKCEFDYLSEHLIKQVLDELFAIKQANIYGITDLNFTSEKKVEEKVNAFVQHYFFQIYSDITDDFCQWKERKYPQTCKIITNNLKSFKNVFKNLKIINAKTLFKDSDQKLKKNKNPESDYCFYTQNKEKEYNYLFCALLQTTNEGLKPFKNLVYNELLWQNLFNSYANHQLSLNPNLEKKEIEEINNLKNDQIQIVEATNTTLEQLATIQNTYPVHIGMLIYQEDLLRLRNDYLSKIINPFYSLFHKLQNVQVPG